MKRQILIALVIATLAACLGFMKAPAPYEQMLTSSVSLFNVDGTPVGSGVIIEDNVVATAAHVLKFIEQKYGMELTIRLYDGTLVEATEFYYDDEHDVGIIFVELIEESIAKTGGNGQIGDEIFIVGNSFGSLEFSLTDGIISHLSRQFITHEDLLQVTAPIGPGNSGGPLYDKHGKVLGVVTGMKGITGFSAVTKIKYVKQFYEELKNGSNN